MKLLRICANGLPAFENGKVDIDFTVKQRVTDDDRDQLSQVGNATHLFANNVIGFSGINASGKTTVLTLISFVFSWIENWNNYEGAYEECFKLQISRRM